MGYYNFTYRYSRIVNSQEHLCDIKEHPCRILYFNLLNYSKCNRAYPKSFPQTSIISNIFSQSPLPFHLSKEKKEEKSVLWSTIIRQET